MSTTEALNTHSIREYNDAIYGLMYDLSNTKGADPRAVPFAKLLRPFLFWNQDFDDLLQMMAATLPVFTGFHRAAATRSDYSFIFANEELDKLLYIGAQLLDQEQFEISEREDPAEMLRPPYNFEELARQMDDFYTLVKAEEERLGLNGNDAIKELMAIDPLQRVEQYKDLVMSIISAKNAVYNIIRSHGKVLLPDIEAHIESLIPGDQNYILHGLDAFPSDPEILDFLRQFIKKHQGEWIAEKASVYAQRVESGIKTSGWE